MILDCRCNRAFFNGDSKSEPPQLHRDDEQDFAEMSEETTWTTYLVVGPKHEEELKPPQLHRARIPAASQDELARRGTRTTAASPSSFPPMISSESMVWLTGGRGGGADSFCLRRLSCLLRQFSCRKFHFIHDNDKGYEIDRIEMTWMKEMTDQP
uniref:Uncharacterized protein n=1 Tax=Brassica campestris TaxID=3711 RepID=M4DCZ3_BRACM